MAQFEASQQLQEVKIEKLDREVTKIQQSIAEIRRTVMPDCHSQGGPISDGKKWRDGCMECVCSVSLGPIDVYHYSFNSNELLLTSEIIRL